MPGCGGLYTALEQEKVSMELTRDSSGKWQNAQRQPTKRASLTDSRQVPRQDFADSRYWEGLARARGLLLPHWSTRWTTGRAERWLRKLGITVAEYLDWDGGKLMKDFGQRNPDWPLRAWVGLLLEWRKK